MALSIELIDLAMLTETSRVTVLVDCPLPDPAAVAWAAFCGVAVRLITDTARRELDPAVRCFKCRCSTELFKDCIFRN
jgi:hypothetical protein